MVKHLLDKDREKLLTISYLEKRAKDEEKSIKRIMPIYHKAVKRVRLIEAGIKTHSDYYHAYIRKRDEIINGNKN